MADKFYVGQRVIWKVDEREYLATVISQRERRQFMKTGQYTLVYTLDLDGYGARHPQGYRYAAPEPELRPLYDGDQPSTWSECAWQPSRLEAGVRHG